VAKLIFVFGFCLALAGCSGGSHGDNSDGTTQPSPSQIETSSILSITPVAQETDEWCYAASAQMIFIYYGLPDLNAVGDYQCGVVAAYNAYIFPQHPECANDCSLCAEVSGGTMDEVQTLIDQYGMVANQLGVPSRVLTSALLFSPLSMDDVMTEIDAGRPILAGISPGGYAFPDVSQHAVVIVGFDSTGASPALIINDPFPYDAFFTQQPNPYLAAGGSERQPGQYDIPYSSFISSMVWGNSIYQIQ
jgi:Papain-like cysteine protease AvrRpt2